MGSVVPNRDGQSAPLRDVYEALGACLLKRGLSAQPRSNHSLNAEIFVLGQRLELLIVLSHGVGKFARCRADLHGNLRAVFAQDSRQLSVAHKVFLGRARGGEQVFFHQLGFLQVHLQQVAV